MRPLTNIITQRVQNLFIISTDVDFSDLRMIPVFKTYS